jgi:hypothetical protein
VALCVETPTALNCCDGLSNRRIATNQIHCAADRTGRVEHGDEDCGDIVAGNPSARKVFPEAYPTCASVIGQAAGAYDGRLQPAVAYRIVRAALRPQIHTEGVVAGGVGIRPHAADDHVTVDSSLLRRRYELHRTAVVHRVLTCGSTSRTRTCSEHHGIGPGDRLSNVVLARLLEVDDRGLRTDLSYVVGMVGIANEGDDIVTAVGQDFGEALGNLAVASGNGYSHGLKLRPAPADGLLRVGTSSRTTICIDAPPISGA